MRETLRFCAFNGIIKLYKPFHRRKENDASLHDYRSRRNRCSARCILSKTRCRCHALARGAHLKAMQEKGLTFEQSDGETWTVPVKAFDMDGFLAAKAQGTPSPDVIFVWRQGIFPRRHHSVHPRCRGRKHGRYPHPQHLRHRPRHAGAASRPARDRRLHLYLVQPQRPRASFSATARFSA